MKRANDLQDRARRYRRLAEALSQQDAEIVNALASELEAQAETLEPPFGDTKRGVPELAEGTSRSSRN